MTLLNFVPLLALSVCFNNFFSVNLLLGRKYAVRDVVEGIEYEFRVFAVNLSGAGESSNPSEFAFARDPKSKPYSC